eukprot:SAG31_NODE_6474_length_2004_cov_1.698163_3_plen_68_part_01
MVTLEQHRESRRFAASSHRDPHTGLWTVVDGAGVISAPDRSDPNIGAVQMWCGAETALNAWTSLPAVA